MAYPFEPIPSQSVQSQINEEKAKRVLACARVVYLSWAAVNTEDTADFNGSVSFYIARKMGLHPEDPVVIDDNKVMRYLGSLGGRYLEYVRILKEGDSYELHVGKEFYRVETIAQKTCSGVPIDLETNSLKYTETGFSLGGMPLDLAVALDRVSDCPGQVSETYLDTVVELMDVFNAPDVRRIT